MLVFQSQRKRSPPLENIFLGRQQKEYDGIFDGTFGAFMFIK